ncbi:MAG: TRAP transporter small permease subunit, partial [Oscillospiraceae bacterium]|nr:TRAP transporter small permease subunit [Oscillospiraceae bacterium]
MKKLSKVMEIIGGIFFLACGGYVILNIITRTFFNSPLRGVYEMTGLFAIIFAACAVVICIIEDGNVFVDVVVSHMRPKARLVLKYFSHIVDIL